MFDQRHLLRGVERVNCPSSQQSLRVAIAIAEWGAALRSAENVADASEPDNSKRGALLATRVEGILPCWGKTCTGLQRESNSEQGSLPPTFKEPIPSRRTHKDELTLHSGSAAPAHQANGLHKTEQSAILNACNQGLHYNFSAS